MLSAAASIHRRFPSEGVAEEDHTLAVAECCRNLVVVAECCRNLVEVAECCRNLVEAAVAP